MKVLDNTTDLNPLDLKPSMVVLSTKIYFWVLKRILKVIRYKNYSILHSLLGTNEFNYTLNGPMVTVPFISGKLL